MCGESGKVLAGIASLLIVAAMLLTPETSAAQPYTISGYVFVNGAPADDVLVYTSYGGGNSAISGTDSIGRHGYYTLATAPSDSPATVIALYTKSPNASAGNYSAVATIEHPDTADGYDMQNLYIDTSRSPVSPTLSLSPSPTKNRSTLGNIAHVVNNFIGRLADWAANIGNSPGSGTVIARAATFDGAGVPDAYLALVNASNLSEEIYRARANDQGMYRFQNVKSSYNTTSGGYDRAYCLKALAYVNTSEGVSTPFAVIPGQAVNVTAVIFPQPASITLEGPGCVGVHSHALFMAYVADAAGHPVADGYMITFTLSSNDTTLGQFGPKGAESPMGLSITVPTRGGYAEAEYGWGTQEGDNTITAAYRDNKNVKGSMAVRVD